MNLTRSAAACAAAAMLLAGTLGAAPSFAKAKKAAPKPKAKAMTFMCQHGCKKNITVKTDADMAKMCPVCGCHQTIKACKPADKKK